MLINNYKKYALKIDHTWRFTNSNRFHIIRNLNILFPFQNIFNFNK